MTDVARFIAIESLLRCTLIDSMTLRQQLTSLERCVDTVDATGHDDVACAACGALVSISGPARSYYDLDAMGSGNSKDDPDGRNAWHMARFLEHVRMYG